MSKIRIDSYNIKSFKLLGIECFTRKRELINVKSDKIDSLINLELPISILFLAKYPYIKGDKSKFWNKNNWEDFTSKLICYSILESYFSNSIEIIQFDDKIKILYGFIEDKIRRFVITPSNKDGNHKSWMNNIIEDIASTKFDKLKLLPHSSLTEQISFLIDNGLSKSTKYRNPQKEFALSYAHKQTKQLDWIKMDQVKKNYIIFTIEKIELNFIDKSFDTISLALEDRISFLNKLIRKDKFIERFYDRLNEVVVDEFSKRIDNDD